MACEPPQVQLLDVAGRLHCETGPALLCRDGWPVYAWHGVRVSLDIIENPEQITPKRIESEKNAEVRRVMIERYGFEHYLRDGKFKKEQQDDFGSLWRRSFSDEPDVVIVRVVNSTPEPDGTYKEYYLPVPSHIRTAHEAVATSFGLKTQEYYPSLES
jgi:hypothetical protein